MNFSIFHWHSIKTRATFTTLVVFVISIWSLAFYSGYTLKKDMEQTLGEQQFSTVSIIAAEINTGLDDRMKALENVAALITPVMLGNAATMQKFIEGHAVLSMMFNGGFFVLLPDGTAIADYPLSTGRRGVNFTDRKYAIGALKEGKTTIGNPVMGKALRSTLFSIATPIYNTKGEVIGALAGTVDLAKPNFISRITDNSYGKTGGYLLVAPETRTIVYATDKKRIMEVLPGPGFNPLIDRAIKGWEGSGITIRPSNGVQILSSVKGVPVSGWYAVTNLPTTEAFAPIRAMQQRMLLAAIFLTLLAGFLTWWMLKRQLAPVFSTIKTLAVLSDTDHPPQPLPITRQDEIGELIGGFNHLLETLGQREETLKENEEKFSKAFQTSPYAITITRAEDGTFVEVNNAFISMTGFTREEALAGSSVGLKLWVNEEDRNCVVAAFNAGQAVVGKEYQFRKKTGKIITGLLSAQTIHLSHGPCILSSINDITSRKLAEEDLKQTTEKLRISLIGTIQAMSLMVETKDPYTTGHQRKVSNLARAIAQEMGLPNDTVDTIRIAGIIHDIGKISVPAEILSKPGILSNIEISLIRVHSQSGYNILKNVGLPYPIADMVLQHHERLDGSGYPQGLKNGQILLEARIISIADVVEAIASHRPYRPGFGIDFALEEIEKNKGIIYDEKVVDVCVRLFREKGFKFESIES